MRFTDQSHKPPGENIVPMINVVFLLLIFFLMTAQIAPLDPFGVTPPVGEGAPVDADAPLYIAADGALAYGDARGAAVFAALSARGADTPLLLRADAGLPADKLADVLPRLAAAGQARVTLLLAPK